MPGEAENQGQANRAAADVAARPVHAGTGNGPPAHGTAPPSNTALVVAGDPAGEAAPKDPARDERLDRLPMQLDVMVRIHSFRVQDLLSLEKGAVVETVHEHTQDVPVRCRGTLLVWGEFEVLDQALAVRITRLA
jgi:flagellar motor switch/type III secretory pathway protein FliN